MAELDPRLILLAGQNNSIGVPELLQQSAATYDMLQTLPLLQKRREQEMRTIDNTQRNDAQQQQRQQAQILLQNARALKNLPMEQRATYVANLDPQVLQTFGIDRARLGSMQLDDVSLSNAIAQLEAVATTGQQTLPTSASERERASFLRAAQGAYNADGTLKPRSQLTPEQTNALVELGVIPRLQGSATQTALELGNVDDVADASGTIEAGKTEGRLLVEEQIKPRIAAAVKLAEQQAAAQGEAFTEFKRAEASLPGVQEVVNQLRELAPLATYTYAGRFFDEATKQMGFGTTKGANARAKFTALIDNQVLPLLRETFGAAFTVKEMETLKAAMGDPDASPEAKLAQLEAFIQNKYRELERKEREAASLGSPVTPNTGAAPKRLKFNPATGRLE